MKNKEKKIVDPRLTSSELTISLWGIESWLKSYFFFFSLFSYILSSLPMGDDRCASFTSSTINFDFLMHSRPSYSINCFFFVPRRISGIWLRRLHRHNHVIILQFFYSNEKTYQIENVIILDSSFWIGFIEYDYFPLIYWLMNLRLKLPISKSINEVKYIKHYTILRAIMSYDYLYSCIVFIHIYNKK